MEWSLATTSTTFTGYFAGETPSISEEQQREVASHLRTVKCVLPMLLCVALPHPADNICVLSVHARRIRRPHILKIDVEGHDFQVLMSFFRWDTPVSQLPLLVEFEAKSIAKNFPKAKERLESLGYIVSPYGQDGFAILPRQKILESIHDVAPEQGMPGDTELDA